MLFLFDDGDEWLFKIELTGLADKAGKVRYPRLVAAQGRAPPHYPVDDEDEDEG